MSCFCGGLSGLPKLPQVRSHASCEPWGFPLWLLGTGTLLGPVWAAWIVSFYSLSCSLSKNFKDSLHSIGAEYSGGTLCSSVGASFWAAHSPHPCSSPQPPPALASLRSACLPTSGSLPDLPWAPSWGCQLATVQAVTGAAVDFLHLLLLMGPLCFAAWCQCLENSGLLCLSGF